MGEHLKEKDFGGENSHSASTLSGFTNCPSICRVLPEVHLISPLRENIVQHFQPECVFVVFPRIKSALQNLSNVHFQLKLKVKRSYMTETKRF